MIEQIRDKRNIDEDLAKYAGIGLTLEEVDWLIEQAEELEEFKNRFSYREYVLKLKQENEQLRKILLKIQEEYHSGSSDNDFLNFIKELVEESEQSWNG